MIIPIFLSSGGGGAARPCCKTCGRTMPPGSLDGDLGFALALAGLMLCAAIGCVFKWTHPDYLMENGSWWFGVAFGGFIGAAVATLGGMLGYGIWFCAKTFWTSLKRLTRKRQ